VDGLVRHQSGGVRADGGTQRLQIDIAFAVGGNLAHRVATHHCSGGIGAVRGVGNDDLAAGVVIARIVIGADHRHAGEFTLRAGHRRHRYAGHAGDVFQHFLQFIHRGEETLPGFGRGMRMPVP